MSAWVGVSCPYEGCDGDFEVLVEFYGGEPAVPYYRDGSGYPGSPPAIEIEDWRRTPTSCDHVLGEPDLDSIAEGQAEAIFDHQFDAEEAARDAAAEAALDRYREEGF